MTMMGVARPRLDFPQSSVYVTGPNLEATMILAFDMAAVCVVAPASAAASDSFDA
jgi:hypothetical protein